MNAVMESQRKSFVLVPIGCRRLAFAAESVVELVATGKLQTFPHHTRWIAGVIVRRGRVVPVCDVSRLFGETDAPLGRFYLIAEWRAGDTRDWCAIPAAGECELASADEILPADATIGSSSAYVSGLVRASEENIGILDLAKLIHDHERAFEPDAPEPVS